jgi:hypothetical protein
MQLILVIGFLLILNGFNASTFIIHVDEGDPPDAGVPGSYDQFLSESNIGPSDLQQSMISIGQIILFIAIAYRIYASWIQQFRFRYDNLIIALASVAILFGSISFLAMLHENYLDDFSQGYYQVLLGNLFVLTGAALNERFYRRKLGSIISKISFESVVKNLPTFAPNVPVSINRISQLSRVSVKQTEGHINKILEVQPEIGEYKPLEQVFIRNDDTAEMIDSLIGEFELMETKGKIGKEE